MQMRHSMQMRSNMLVSEMQCRQACSKTSSRSTYEQGGGGGDGTSRVVGPGVGAGKGTDSKVGITCWSRPCRAEQLGIRKERGKVATAWPMAVLEEELV